jgi:hypothetical protein
MGVASLRIGDGSGETWGPAADRLLDDVDASDTFGSDWARQQQARLFAVDHDCREWAETTALLTATASTTWPGPGDDLIPPVVHLRRGLLLTRDARQRALSRALQGTSWRAIRVYGTDTNGYLHRHTAVYVGDDVGESAFEGWRSAHTSNSPLADETAHGPGAVEVRDVADEDRGLVAYVMRNTPGLDTRGERGHGLASAPSEQQRGAVVLDRAGVAPLTFGHT